MGQTYEAEAGVVSVNSSPKERLRKIAKSQRVILFFILMYIPLIFMMFALVASNWPFSLALILVFFIFAYVIYSFVHLLSLANEVGGLVTAIVCGVLFWLFPPVGFLLLLFINARASRLLKNEGYKVGLLGVNPNEHRFSQVIKAPEFYPTMRSIQSGFFYRRATGLEKGPSALRGFSELEYGLASEF